MRLAWHAGDISSSYLVLQVHGVPRVGLGVRQAPIAPCRAIGSLQGGAVQRLGCSSAVPRHPCTAKLSVHRHPELTGCLRGK